MLRLHSNGIPANWLYAHLGAIGGQVRSIVPQVYDSYARLLHPASTYRDGAEHELRWDELASERHVPLLPDVQWSSLEEALATVREDPDVLGVGVPAEGSLQERQAARLATILERHTSTPDTVWFCVWDGWGALKVADGSVGLTRDRRFRSAGRRRKATSEATPQVHLPDRDYFLFSGATRDAALSFGVPPSWQSASMWWPDDHAWFVATEVDFTSTYVGASRSCASSLLSAAGLEALVAHPADRITPELT